MIELPSDVIVPLLLTTVGCLCAALAVARAAIAWQSAPVRTPPTKSDRD